MNKTLLQEIKAMNKIAGTQMTKEQEIAFIKNRLQELEFGTQQAFDDYKKNHDMRPDTKVKVAGKQTTAGEASKKSAPTAKGTSVFGGDKKAKPKKSADDDFDKVSPDEYAEYGVDPNDPDADTVVRFARDFRKISNSKNKKGPSFMDSVIDWFKQKKADYKFGKRAYDAGFRLNEDTKK